MKTVQQYRDETVEIVQRAVTNGDRSPERQCGIVAGLICAAACVAAGNKSPEAMATEMAEAALDAMQNVMTEWDRRN